MIEDNAYRMDIMFYNSVKKARARYVKYLCYHTIKTILLSIFLGLYYQNNPKDNFYTSFIFATVVGGCYMIAYLAVLIQLSNNETLIEIATRIEHVGKQPVGSANIAFEDQLNSNVASVYDFTNPTIEYTDEQKSQFQSAYGETIAQTIMQEQCLLRSSVSILNMCSLALIIYFIYGVAALPTDATQKGVIITYIVLESISKIQTLILLIILALCPIILLILCCICCCCKPKQEQQYQMPEINVIDYSPNLNLEDNQCRICYQNFAINDKIKILPCNNKHIFHDFCISSWFRVANTCPLCRKQMSDFVNGNGFGNANNNIVVAPVSSSSGENI